MDYKRLGQRVREYRTKNFMTQEKLAEKVSLSTNYISQIENGARKSSLETIISIANTLKVSVDCLLKDSIIMNQDVNVKELMILLQNRSEEEVSLVLDLVRTTLNHTEGKNLI